jgi:hypothetical protein
MINYEFFIFGLAIGLFVFYIIKKNPNIVYVLPNKDQKFIDNKNRCYRYLKKKI